MSTFPARFQDTAGETRLDGQIQFPTTQPASTSAASYVTVGAADPSPLTTFVTPLVFNTTGTSGGLWAWTGTTYTKVGLATT